MNDINRDTYCSMAFSGYDTRSKSFCCWAKLRNYNTYTDLINSEETKKLHSDLLNGIKNPICESCWKHEELGIDSMRQSHTNKKTNEQIETEINQKRIHHLIIDSGTVCNLACRTCGSWSSSSHVKEEEERSKRFGISKKYQYRPFIPDYENLLKEDLSSVKHVSILGGEPFLNLDHLVILQKIIDDGEKDKSCRLNYVTNATVKIPDKAVNMFGQFERVSFVLSIDAIGDRFSYIRTNGIWDSVLENLDCLKKYSDQFGHISLVAHPTVSVLNVLYLDELLEWFSDNDLIYTFIVVVNPSHYSFNAFNDNQKSILIDRLSNSRFDMSPIINSLKESKYDEEAMRRFWKEIDFTNDFKKLNAKDYIPELLEFMRIPE